MENFVKMLAGLTVRELNEFERAIEVLHYDDLTNVIIALNAMSKLVKTKRANLPEATSQKG